MKPSGNTFLDAMSSLATRKGASLAAPAIIAVGALMSLGSVPAPAQAPKAAIADAGPFSPDQKQAIEKIIKDYLIANPELFMEIQGALEAKMEAQQSEKIKKAIAENGAEIFRRPGAPVVGNVNGDITIVEFFDYNCGYCKRGFTDLAKLMEKDPKVKVVMKELPILSKGSEEASRVALAAKAQGKYWEFHKVMIESKAQANEAAALKIAEKLGLDMVRVKKDMDSAEVKGEIQKVRELAQKMGIQGTPHFLIGEKVIPGAPENLYEQLATYVAEVRKTGCKVC